MKSRELKAAVTTLACLGLITISQANTNDNDNAIDKSQSQSSGAAVDTGAGVQTGAQSQTAQSQMPTKFNKASGLIGMSVQNEQGEKLGDIKDLVVDLDSGKISYAVLSSGGVFGIGEKLIAVPIKAFSRSDRTASVSSDNKNALGSNDYLVLHASKDSVQQAQGIGDNWPSVQQPSFGAEPFWEKSDQQKSPSATQSSEQESQPATPRTPDQQP